VKLHGQRIELGEITAALRDLPGVTNAVTVLRENQIVAYVVGEPDVGALSARLPAYMLPAHYVPLDELPTTRHGKLDTRRLPSPEAPSSGRPPETEPERILAKLYEELLQETVSADDDFFKRGGDSIDAIQLVSRARRQGVHITAKQVFEHRTVAGLASVSRAAGGLAETDALFPTLTRAQLDDLEAEYGGSASADRSER
jgi:aryl carrier-like protein